MQKKRMQKINTILIMILNMAGALTAAVGSTLVMPVAQNKTEVVLNIAYLLIVYALSFFIHLIIHEAGHMVFGLLTGYRFNSFRVFSFMLQLDDDGKIRFYRHSVAGTAGQCLMEPPDAEPEKLPYILYNLGGILANIILSAVFAPMCLLTQAGGYLIAVFICLTIIGILTAVVNGIPLPGVINDGRNIVELHRHEKARLSFYVQLKSQILLKKGIRIRDFPVEWFIMPDYDELQVTQSSILAVYCCERLFDERKFSEAHDAIDLLLRRNAALFTLHEQQLKANALYCELIGSMDSRRISDYYDKTLQKTFRSMSGFPSFIRTEYAYQLLYNKDEQKAARQLALFESAAKKYPFQIEIKTERELLELAQKTALEREMK